MPQDKNPSLNRSAGLGHVREPREAVRRIRNAALVLGIIVVTGTTGYMFIEHWSFLDALYMTVITVSTVGYKEVNDLDATGRVLTMLIIITGVGTLFYAAVSFVELMVEGTIGGYFERRRMEDVIGKLSKHYILCGYGRVGQQVAREFAAENADFVVIDQQEDVVEECISHGQLALLGEASDDTILEAAGVRRAKGLVAALDSDSANVFVTLSARKMNPDLHIVARADSEENAGKLEMAGADRTLSPYAVGGRRLAALAVQPLIVDFLDIVTRGEKGLEFRLEEIEVPGDSHLVDQTIADAGIGERTGTMILAIRDKEDRFNTNPSARDKLRLGDVLIVLGTRDQVTRLEDFMRGRKL